MAKYYLISGYWKDNEEKFVDYVVTSAMYTEEYHHILDDVIFLYETTEEDIKRFMDPDSDSEILVTSYKSLLCEEAVKMDSALKYPNGFDSWCETLYEVSVEIENYSEVYGSLAYKIYQEMGRGGLYELAKDLTDELEQKFKVLTDNPPEGYNEDWFEYMTELINKKMFNNE